MISISNTFSSEAFLPSHTCGRGVGGEGAFVLPGVARRLVIFFASPRQRVAVKTNLQVMSEPKVTKKSRPQSATSARFPVLLGWTGFLTNSHDPLRVHVLNHVGYDITLRLVSTATSRYAPCCRQNSLTSLRYSEADEGRVKQEFQKPCFVGWANCPPTIKQPRGQFAHPTTPAEIER